MSWPATPKTHRTMPAITTARDTTCFLCRDGILAVSENNTATNRMWSTMVNIATIDFRKNNIAASAFDACSLSRRRSAVHGTAAVAAVGAHIPLQFQEMLAAWTGAAQLGAAGWAGLKIM